MEDLISIIVTVYNNEKTLKECIMSVISQTYRNIEVIVIDDGSDDDSAKICNELILENSKMKLIHQLHSGVASARNRGFELASGQYVTFVNASDVIENNMLEKLHDMMDDFSIELSMCSTYSEKRISKVTDQVITFDKVDALRQLLIGKIITSTPYAKLFKRSIFENIRFADGESDTIYRLTEKCQKIAFNNSQLYLMNEKENYTFTSLINKDMRLLRTYPDLEIFCKCNIVKSIQNEYYDSIVNNRPLIDENNIYAMFTKIVKDSDTDIDPFLSSVRKAHMYLLYNDENNYRILCPVLPDIYIEDEN